LSVSLSAVNWQRYPRNRTIGYFARLYHLDAEEDSGKALMIKIFTRRPVMNNNYVET
jgi:hypothetical protein